MWYAKLVNFSHTEFLMSLIPSHWIWYAKPECTMSGRIKPYKISFTCSANVTGQYYFSNSITLNSDRTSTISVILKPVLCFFHSEILLLTEHTHTSETSYCNQIKIRTHNSHSAICWGKKIVGGIPPSWWTHGLGDLPSSDTGPSLLECSVCEPLLSTFSCKTMKKGKQDSLAHQPNWASDSWYTGKWIVSTISYGFTAIDYVWVR
jgi:hypothetical protein